MSANLISLIGGGITAAATLAVGISTSGILAANPTDIDAGQVSGETVYVEQPIIEVAGVPTPTVPGSVDPIVIAILPAPEEADPVAPDPSMSPVEESYDDEYLEDESEYGEDEYESDEDEEHDGHEEGEDGEDEGHEEGEDD
jgi:hypothetical protein